MILIKLVSTVSIFSLLLTSVRSIKSKTAFPEPAARSLFEFGFDVYESTARSSGNDANVLVSPISMFAVLSILAPGLGGNSHTEVVRALHMSDFESPSDVEAEMCLKVFAHHPYHNLSRANRIFADNDVLILKTFKDSSRRHHKAPVKRLDFHSKPRQSRSKMNRFVAKETGNEIPELIPEGVVTNQTKIFLVNAVAMTAEWSHTFPKSATTTGMFHVSPNMEVSVPMMRSAPSIGSKCWQTYDSQLQSNFVIMPFKGLALRMVIIMPDEVGDFQLINTPGGRDGIRRLLLEASLAKPRFWKCDITMPKFTVRHNIANLEDVLRNMGVRDIFSPGAADLSKITPFPGIYVSNAGHEAVLHVDEIGVKAAAASYLSVGLRGPGERVILNKPFMYLIRHEPTGAILFMGKLVRPDLEA